MTPFACRFTQFSNCAEPGIPACLYKTRLPISSNITDNDSCGVKPMARKQVRQLQQTVLYRLTLLHPIIHDTYSTQDICNAKYNSSRLLGLLHKQAVI